MQHSESAAEDFGKCIDLQSKRGGAPDARSYFVRASVRLGDALAKNGDITATRQAWQDGLKLFPGDPDLGERVALSTAAEALSFVEKCRNLEEQVDTDFKFLLSP